MTDVSPHAWFRPRLAKLMQDAEAAGIARDVSVAVVTDLVNGALGVAVPASADDEWNRDIVEPDGAVEERILTTPDDPGGHVGNPLEHVGHRRWQNKN
jgi:hypothetical protein